MSFAIRAVEDDGESTRKAVLESLIAYNDTKAGDSGYRGQGVGTELMRRGEAEAVARGCHGVWLDTFEFQARGLYERLGYTCFGELENYPVGPRFFMSKRVP